MPPTINDFVGGQLVKIPPRTHVGWIGLGLFALVVGSVAAGNLAMAEPSPLAGLPQVSLRMNESEPVIADGLEFVAVAQSQWTFYDPPGVDRAIEVQLRITNRTQDDLIFPTFDTFRVGLVGPDAREITRHGGRLATRRTRPVVIPAGKTYTLCRESRLEWDEAGTLMKLVYLDGTGTVLWFALPEPGRYTLRFACEYPRKQQAPALNEFEGIKVWQGAVKTKGARVEVFRLAPPARPPARL